jgi:lipopolysaccharide/colanic/teichoic acid biosynthesis glycosyltransferase
MTKSSGLAAVVFERTVAALGLLILSPLLLFIGFLIAYEDGFPVLFRQTRVGRGGRGFSLVKFRSMRMRCVGARITAANDPRLTRFGAFLRRYKLDELPQLWSVVKGDMSLVGPRPEVPHFVGLDDPVWSEVLRVRPGITDLASLVYRQEEDLLARSSNPEAYYRDVVLPAKLALNLHYLQVRSFWRDVRLIVLTVRFSFVPAGFDASRVREMFSTPIL